MLGLGAGGAQRGSEGVSAGKTKQTQMRQAGGASPPGPGGLAPTPLRAPFPRWGAPRLPLRHVTRALHTHPEQGGDSTCPGHPCPRRRNVPRQVVTESVTLNTWSQTCHFLCSDESEMPPRFSHYFGRDLGFVSRQLHGFRRIGDFLGSELQLSVAPRRSTRHRHLCHRCARSPSHSQQEALRSGNGPLCLEPAAGFDVTGSEEQLLLRSLSPARPSPSRTGTCHWSAGLWRQHHRETLAPVDPGL